jgi:hypothetical protein
LRNSAEPVRGIYRKEVALSEKEKAGHETFRREQNTQSVHTTTRGHPGKTPRELDIHEQTLSRIKTR